MLKLKKISILLVILIISFLLPQITLGIGQITKPIFFENILRGQVVQETLTLYGSEEKETTYGLVADGDIKNWATFYLPEDLENPIQEIKIPARTQANVIAQFQAPEDIPNGTYLGTVAIVSLPEKTEEGEGISASVRLRLDREVSISITDQEIIKFETAIIPSKYGINKDEPLKIKVIYDNKGNVLIKPDFHLKIIQLNTDKIVHNAIYPYPENEKAVKPLERKVFENLIEWQSAGQEEGRYKAEVKILLNGKSMKEESFRFTVGEVSWVADNKFFHFLALIGGGNFVVGWFIIGGVILVITIILNSLSKRKKQKFLKTETQGEIIEEPRE